MFARLPAACAYTTGEVTARVPRTAVTVEVECREGLPALLCLQRRELRCEDQRRCRRVRGGGVDVHGALCRNIGKIDSGKLRQPGVRVPREARRHRVLAAAHGRVDRQRRHRRRVLRGAAVHRQFHRRKRVVVRRQHRRHVAVRVRDADVRLREQLRFTVAHLCVVPCQCFARVEAVLLDDVQVVGGRTVAVVCGRRIRHVHLGMGQQWRRRRATTRETRRRRRNGGATKL